MSQSNPDATLSNSPLNYFSNRALDYAKYRPSYPDAAIDLILEGLRSPSQLVCADIGAGTGISSRLLAKRGVKVLAIEPNAQMRQAADPHPLVQFRDATAEVTGLASASVDLVTCFQSFHWFKPVPTLNEFQRILKPSGRIALVWSFWDATDLFTANYIRMLSKAVKPLNYQSFSGQVNRFLATMNPLPINAIAWLQYWCLWKFLGMPNFVSALPYRFTYRHELDLPGLIGLARSQSVMPLTENVQHQLISNLQQLYKRHSDERGCVTLVYRTSVFLT